MWKLFTIVALAASIVSAPAFAQSARNYGRGYQQYEYNQGGGSGIPWVDDHAKGPVA